MERLVRWPDALREVSTARLVSVAGHLVDQQLGRYLTERHGLSLAGVRVLFVLARTEPATHREVAELCFVRPATLTGIVDTLERDGFVSRRRGAADRRSVQLMLTDKGREHVRQLTDLMHRDDPLTSVDADPAKKAVIRTFLTELITKMSDGEDSILHSRIQDPGETAPGGSRC
ncbi:MULTISPECIES: MarR family winged helix-turn-helix transcriptional regulator [unclassified Micromonospora]|uniref:MarR family winged helix-turn-helix transcriptional regulator n=1 Tax=unclassified Micromonospora TaxID=2617518 RepID=UPI00104B908E|nr:MULTISPECIES: MarR family transcriptional regulator [unclassified Micromonospora]TDB79664.1 MarR family transcriptional regulator [Micromonospora sp. KC721]TDC41776.1 MarR family transcriptional regulator [Micromonospora sp. KC213]